MVERDRIVCTLSCFSRVQLFVTLWNVARQAPLSVGFSRQEYWSALLQGVFLTQGSNPCLLWLLHCRRILYHWATREACIYVVQLDPTTVMEVKGHLLEVLKIDHWMLSHITVFLRHAEMYIDGVPKSCLQLFWIFYILDARRETGCFILIHIYMYIHVYIQREGLSGSV